MTLATMGFWWIDVESVSKKRTYVLVPPSVYTFFDNRLPTASRAAQPNEPWRPKAGDVIVSNWASWPELLWLAFRQVHHSVLRLR